MTKIRALISRLKSLAGREEISSRRAAATELKLAREEIAEKNRELAEKSRRLRRFREQAEKSEQEVERLRLRFARGDAGSINPENLVWIFGTGRTGSTWLATIMEELSNHEIWFEPRVGSFFNPANFERYKGKNFILSPKYKETWLNSIRRFVLDGAGARFPGATERGFLVTKEPGGSEGAELLMEALPESRMVLLVRDPRDVVASWIDAARKGGWQNERRRKDRIRTETLADTNPNAFAKRHADTYLRNVGNARRAYAAHKGRKVLIRYEDLRADTLGTMKQLYSTLEVPVDERELVRAVEKHTWDNIPKEEKGQGKFYRKASPGGWQEDLTAEQVKIVEKITAPLLKEFYPE